MSDEPAPQEPLPRKKKRPYHRPRRQKGRRSTRQGEHRSVLPRETLEILNPSEGKMYVDCTLGYAGHSVELLRAVGPTGKLIALDLDPGNLSAAEEKLGAVGNPYAIHHFNFAGIASVLAMEGVSTVDGILADLGMSSMQVDDRERGFSFMRDGPLDMRMDPTRGKTAATLLNTLTVEELATAFRELGDEPAAETIAAAIATRRAEKPLERTLELRELIETAAPVRVLKGPGRPPARKQRMLPMTRVFQSLRILVNREIANLQSLLRVAPSLLNPGGVVAIICFHSGEDRLVKNAFREGLRAGLYSEIADDPIRPSEEEKVENPRARSAKLRWARKR